MSWSASKRYLAGSDGLRADDRTQNAFLVAFAEIKSYNGLIPLRRSCAGFPMTEGVVTAIGSRRAGNESAPSPRCALSVPRRWNQRDVSGARDRNRCPVVRGQRHEDVPNIGVIGEHFRQLASQYSGEMPVGRVVSAPAPSQLFFPRATARSCASNSARRSKTRGTTTVMRSRDVSFSMGREEYKRAPTPARQSQGSERVRRTPKSAAGAQRFFRPVQARMPARRHRLATATLFANRC
jgi:hypothetical protein